MEMYNERLRHVLFHLLREAFNPMLKNDFGISCMPQSAPVPCSDAVEAQGEQILAMILEGLLSFVFAVLSK